ncbi:MAG TPA: iron transporter [Azospirillum sp.]|nr:iron transporter [Azospirillum sp.]
MKTLFALPLAALLAGASAPALAAGRDIGAAEREGMAIVARYIQAVEVESGEEPGQKPAQPAGGHGGHAGHGGPADAHLEALITATRDNAYGFFPGAFVPYLQVEYIVRKQGSAWVGDGVLKPMIASDGPHYAANLLLDGPGKYTVELIVAPPSPKVFPRHLDKETGAKPWWTPVTLEWGFTFVGSTGKKGGY